VRIPLDQFIWFVSDGILFFGQVELASAGLFPAGWGIIFLWRV
jgi:hypothetical protein